MEIHIGSENFTQMGKLKTYGQTIQIKIKVTILKMECLFKGVGANFTAILQREVSRCELLQCS